MVKMFSITAACEQSSKSGLQCGFPVTITQSKILSMKILLMPSTDFHIIKSQTTTSF